MEDKKDKTTLDIFKDIEAKKKKVIANNMLNQIKNMAKEIQELKAKSEILLKHITNDKQEAKQIIDWINELEDVKLSEDDKNKLERQMKVETQIKKKEVDNDFSRQWEKYYTDTSSVVSANYVNPYKSQNVGYTTMSGSTLTTGSLSVSTGTNGIILH